MHNGSVLIGALQSDSISFQLPMGPAFIDVPLNNIVSVHRIKWTGSHNETPTRSSPAGWFDRGAYSKSKRAKDLTIDPSS